MTKIEIDEKRKEADGYRDKALQLSEQGKLALALHEYAAAYGTTKYILDEVLKELNNE